MRQTSRAVALLLAVESAQAALTANDPPIQSGEAYFKTVWMPDVSAANSPTPSIALNSRQAGYTNTAQIYGVTATTGSGSATWKTLTYQKAVA
jgi:hypothetical protein